MPGSYFALSMFPLALALGIYVASRPPKQSLLFLTAVLPFEAFGVIEAGFTVPPAYLVLFAILGGLIARGDSGLGTAGRTGSVKTYLAIATVTTLFAFGTTVLPQVDLSANMQYRAGWWRSPVQLALLIFHFSLFFVIVQYIRGRTAAEALLKVHLWTAICLGCLGIYQIFAYSLNLPFADCTWSINLVDHSASVKYAAIRHYSAQVADFSTRATFPESRNFGEYLLSAVPIMAALCISRRPEIRQRFGFPASPWAVAIGLTAIFFTMSRSAWILIVPALLYVGWKLSRRQLLLIIPGALVLLSVVVVAINQVGYFGGSTGSLFEVIGGRMNWFYIVNDPRIWHFLVLWESFAQHPILGLGAGNFALWGAAFTGSPLLHSAHGFAWATLADFGLVGFVSLVVAFIILLRRLSRAIKFSPSGSTDRVIMIGVFSALLFTLFNTCFGGDRPPFYLMLLMGLAAVYTTLASKNTDECPARPETP